MVLRNLSPAAGPGAKAGLFRRAAAAMEYLFVISLILVAMLTAIGLFGESTRDKTKNASDSIKKALTR